MGREGETRPIPRVRGTAWAPSRALGTHNTRGRWTASSGPRRQCRSVARASAPGHTPQVRGMGVNRGHDAMGASAVRGGGAHAPRGGGPSLGGGGAALGTSAPPAQPPTACPCHACTDARRAVREAMHAQQQPVL